MQSECIQSLSPGFYDINSPESLYPSDKLLTIEVNRATNLMNGPRDMIPTVNCSSFNGQSDSPGGDRLLDLQLPTLPDGATDGTASPLGISSLGSTPNHRLDHEELFHKMQASLGNPICNENSVDSEHSTVASPLFSPGAHTPINAGEEIFANEGNTEMSLVHRSSGLHLDENATLDNMSWNLGQSASPTELTEEDDEATPPSRKAFKAKHESDASSSCLASSAAGAFNSPVGLPMATSLGPPGCPAELSAKFVFTKFGTDISRENAESNITNTPSATPIARSAMPSRRMAGVGNKSYRKCKEPSLTLNFPSKTGGRELRISVQPEEQHRARYLTEGSRGAIKDSSQNGFPTVKLIGYDQPVTLQTFIGNDTGKVRPHGFYQACQVCGKNATPSVVKEIDGTNVIEMKLDTLNDMTATVDCVGILKLRNADVEQRIGLARSKKKSTRARLVFRVNIPNPDGTYQTLQIASSPILCTQPAGVPEICKKSRSEGSVEGGEELFIIGKNFTKGTTVSFEERCDEDVVWRQDAEIDQEYFQASHMICTVPPFKSVDMKEPVEVQVLVYSSGRVSEPSPYVYAPVATPVKLDLPIPKEAESSISKSVAPEAVDMALRFQQDSQKTGGMAPPVLSPGSLTASHQMIGSPQGSGVGAGVGVGSVNHLILSSPDERTMEQLLRSSSGGDLTRMVKLEHYTTASPIDTNGSLNISELLNEVAQVQESCRPKGDNQLQQQQQQHQQQSPAQAASGDGFTLGQTMSPGQEDCSQLIAGGNGNSHLGESVQFQMPQAAEYMLNAHPMAAGVAVSSDEVMSLQREPSELERHLRETASASVGASEQESPPNACELQAGSPSTCGAALGDGKPVIDICPMEPENGSFQQETGSFQQETGSYQQQTESFQQETGSYQQETGSFQQETGSFQQETGSFQQKSSSLQQDANSFMQEAHSFQQEVNTFQTPEQQGDVQAGVQQQFNHQLQQHQLQQEQMQHEQQQQQQQQQLQLEQQQQQQIQLEQQQIQLDQQQTQLEQQQQMQIEQQQQVHRSHSESGLDQTADASPPSANQVGDAPGDGDWPAPEAHTIQGLNMERSQIEQIAQTLKAGSPEEVPIPDPAQQEQQHIEQPVYSGGIETTIGVQAAAAAAVKPEALQVAHVVQSQPPQSLPSNQNAVSDGRSAAPPGGCEDSIRDRLTDAFREMLQNPDMQHQVLQVLLKRSDKNLVINTSSDGCGDGDLNVGGGSVDRTATSNAPQAVIGQQACGGAMVTGGESCMAVDPNVTMRVSGRGEDDGSPPDGCQVSAQRAALADLQAVLQQQLQASQWGSTLGPAQAQAQEQEQAQALKMETSPPAPHPRVAVNRRELETALHVSMDTNECAMPGQPSASQSAAAGPTITLLQPMARNTSAQQAQQQQAQQQQQQAQQQQQQQAQQQPQQQHQVIFLKNVPTPSGRGQQIPIQMIPGRMSNCATILSRVQHCGRGSSGAAVALQSPTPGAVLQLVSSGGPGGGGIGGGGIGGGVVQALQLGGMPAFILPSSVCSARLAAPTSGGGNLEQLHAVIQNTSQARGLASSPSVPAATFTTFAPQALHSSPILSLSQSQAISIASSPRSSTLAPSQALQMPVASQALSLSLPQAGIPSQAPPHAAAPVQTPGGMALAYIQPAPAQNGAQLQSVVMTSMVASGASVVQQPPTAVLNVIPDASGGPGQASLLTHSSEDVEMRPASRVETAEPGPRDCDLGHGTVAPCSMAAGAQGSANGFGSVGSQKSPVLRKLLTESPVAQPRTSSWTQNEGGLPNLSAEDVTQFLQTATTSAR